MGENKPSVQQAVMTLPYFDAEVPIVYLADSTGYIPVVALCRMLGLRPERHIPRWRRLFLWEHARKLPLQTEKRGARLVWCLHLGALLFWGASGTVARGDRCWAQGAGAGPSGDAHALPADAPPALPLFDELCRCSDA